jgi:two-component system sensor histidine kinase YesM
MNKMKSKKSKPILLKLMLIIILVCLPSFVFSSIISFVNFLDINKRIESNIKAISSYEYQAIDNQLKGVIDEASNMVNNSLINRLIIAENSNSDITDMLYKIQSQLEIMKDRNSLIENTVIYIPNINKMLDTEAGIDEIDLLEYKSFYNLNKSMNEPIKILDDSLYILIYYPFNVSHPVTVLEEKQIIISVKLDKNKLLNKILHTSKVNDNIFVFYSIYDFIISDSLNADKAKDISIQVKNKGYKNSERMSLEKCVVLFESSEITGLNYYTCIDKKIFSTGTRNLFVFFMLSLIILIIVIIISANIFKKEFLKPIKVILDSFSRIKKGDLSFKLESNNFSREFDYLYDNFNQTLESMEKLLNRIFEDGIRLRNSEYKQLVYQIKPHFLYNSLHIICCMAKNEDYDGVVSMSKHLSDYFKYHTGLTRSFATLKDEVNHIKNYINVQMHRFGDRISVNIEKTPEQLEQVKVPYLILQPIIENIYSHGLKNKEKDGKCNITFQYDEKDIHIIVEDNGDELEDSMLENLREALKNEDDNYCESIALVNIHRRIQINYGEDYGISFERSKLGGLKVILKLPNYEGGNLNV